MSHYKALYKSTYTSPYYHHISEMVQDRN